MPKDDIKRLTQGHGAKKQAEVGFEFISAVSKLGFFAFHHMKEQKEIHTHAR